MSHGIWLLEIAARSIGGLCGRVLTHSLGMSLEELILRPLVGKPVAEPLALAGESAAAGVMMIPIPRRGIYHGARRPGRRAVGARDHRGDHYGGARPDRRAASRRGELPGVHLRPGFDPRGC